MFGDKTSEAWARLEENHPYVFAFHEGYPYRLLPLYVFAIIATCWMALLTLLIASEHAPAWDPDQLITASRVLMYFLGILPFLYGLSAVVERLMTE